MSQVSSRRQRVVAAGSIAAGMAVAAAGLVVAVPLAAHAADPVETFDNLSSGRCLVMVKDSSSGEWYPVTRSCSSGFAAQWRVHHWNDGTVRLQNVASGTCLTDTTEYVPYGRSCDSSQAESFLVTHYSDGSVRFQSQYTGQCVYDAAGGRFGQDHCTSSATVRWK